MEVCRANSELHIIYVYIPLAMLSFKVTTTSATCTVQVEYICVELYQSDCTQSNFEYCTDFASYIYDDSIIIMDVYSKSGLPQHPNN